MSSEKGALNTLTTIAGLAAFVGAAVLAGAVAITWQPENTSSLITASAAICGGGLAIFAAVFGVFVGLAVYRRMNRTDEPPAESYGRALPSPWRESLPPALPNPDRAGTWAGGGPTAYDVWEEADYQQVAR